MNKTTLTGIIKFALFLISMISLSSAAGWYPKRIENVLIENINAKVTVYAYRDYMPVLNSGDSGLIVGVKIRPLGKNDKLPSNINVIRAEAIVANPSEIWDMTTSKNKSVLVYPNSDGYSIVFREGPTWAVNSYLDILLTIEINQTQYQIDAEYVVLGKTS